jgi:Protein of unknown function (DUF3500)
MASQGGRMVAAAAAFLEALDDRGRRRALLHFDDPRRLRWTYLPGERFGLPLRDMDGDQRLLAHRLLRTALSLPGLAQAVTITAWETVLEAIEGRDDGRRDPGRYHVTVFDRPSAASRWAWRFEGHHLSVSVTLDGDRPVTATPLFLGANPARVHVPAGGALQPLAPEEALARQLLAAFGEEQRRAAVVDRAAPDDILTRTSAHAAGIAADGIPAELLAGPARHLLRRLARLYLGRFHDALAGELWPGAEDDPQLRFAWAGSLEPGQRHYYRLRGERLLVEYDNTQDGANHVHTVVRDLRGDLSVDPLREHRAAAHPPGSAAG